jgi:hyperosmotically inducible periplasmic protein
MKLLKGVTCLALLGLLAGCSKSDNPGTTGGSEMTVSARTRDTNATSESLSATAPDNTRVNARDRSGETLTPGDQGTSEADRETTRRIRKAINANDQLSVDAKNIKIITDNGKVTLRGPVKTPQELEAVKSILQQVGVSSVDNQLEVITPNK